MIDRLNNNKGKQILNVRPDESTQTSNETNKVIFNTKNAVHNEDVAITNIYKPNNNMVPTFKHTRLGKFIHSLSPKQVSQAWR